MPWRRKWAVMPIRLSGRYLRYVSSTRKDTNKSHILLIDVKQAPMQSILHKRP